MDLFIFFHSGLTTAFSDWFTTYFKSLNISLNISSILLTLYSLIFILGMFFKSFLVARFDEKKIINFFSISSFIILFITFFIKWIVVKTILILLFGFSASAIGSLSISVGIKLDPEYSGSIVSMINSFGWAGIIIFQYLTGYLFAKYSAMGLFFITTIALFILVIFTNILNIYYKSVNKMNQWLTS